MSASRIFSILSLVLMPLLLVSNLTLGRAAIETVPPWTLACLRWSITALILWPFAVADIRRHAAAIRLEISWLVLLGFLGMWICGGICYLSLRYTTATHAALIYASSPVIVVVISAILARKMLPFMQIVGVATAVVGVALTTMQGNLLDLRHVEFNGGDLGMLFCAAAWAVYSLVLKRPGFEAIPTIASFFVIAAFGALMLIPCMLYEIATGGVAPFTQKAWLSLGGIVLFASLLSYSSYQYNVRKVGPGVTSVFMYLMPAYGIALAVLFLGESFQPYHAVSLALLIGGVVLATGSDLLAHLMHRRR